MQEHHAAFRQRCRLLFCRRFPIYVFSHDDFLLTLTYLLYRVFVVLIISISQINRKSFDWIHLRKRLIGIHFTKFQEVKLQTVTQAMSGFLLSHIKNAVAADFLWKQLILDDGNYNAFLHLIIRLTGLQ